jgi:glycosyltransferase involved in cell wall biosynthesis
VDIITGDHNPDSTYDFSQWEITELKENSFLNFIISRFGIDWDNYDVAIFSGNRPQFIQWIDLPIPTIRYCHSPTRTFWSLRDRDFREADLLGKLVRIITSPIYRQVDSRLNKKHGKIVTNSHNIRSQVERFYGIDASVVYPPIDVDRFNYSPHENYWLSVNRLVPKKRVDLQIDAFDGIDENLVIIGSIDNQFENYGTQLKRRIQSLPNIRLEEAVSEDKLVSLYSKAKGVVYTPYFEDFGIVPVEAMASGKPVLAIAEGGPMETVVDSKTGWLIPPAQSDLRSILTSELDYNEFRDRCQQRAEIFDEERFKTRMTEIITAVIDEGPTERSIS